MMTKDELQKRVDIRKQELDTEADKLSEFRDRVEEFVYDIKSRSAVYALVKNLSIWKKLEELVKSGGTDAD